MVEIRARTKSSSVSTDATAVARSVPIDPSSSSSSSSSSKYLLHYVNIGMLFVVAFLALDHMYQKNRVNCDDYAALADEGSSRSGSVDGGLRKKEIMKSQAQLAIALSLDNKEKESSNLPSSSSSSSCSLEGSMIPPGDHIIIDFDKIRSINKEPLERIQDYTKESYTKYLLADAGKEHYSFLNYISATYGDCRHFMDIGTRFVTSSLAMGSNQITPVWTFDRLLEDYIKRFNSMGGYERVTAFRGKTEDEWQTQVHNKGVQIKFINLNLLEISDDEFRNYIGTWFVFLDTYHKPYSKPFEREFFQRMIHAGFKGILGLDDIHLNNQMKKWWEEVVDNADKGGYKTYDITKIGHSSGTGLVDFSGKIMIKE